METSKKATLNSPEIKENERASNLTIVHKAKDWLHELTEKGRSKTTWKA